MGKDLHYSIRPFIEKAFERHGTIKSFKLIENNEFYIYKIERHDGLSSLYVVLSDAYQIYKTSVDRPIILNNGGFILIAKPEALGGEYNEEENKIGVGKLAKFMGAMHSEDYWTYEREEG